MQFSLFYGYQKNPRDGEKERGRQITVRLHSRNRVGQTDRDKGDGGRTRESILLVINNAGPTELKTRRVKL